jgi:hypothetical protein
VYVWLCARERERERERERVKNVRDSGFSTEFVFGRERLRGFRSVGNGGGIGRWRREEKGDD